MKRKIAVILAADIAAYSRLVAEDEEDTLRRLIDDRTTFSTIIGRFGGRIFNTGGDSILAEFQSAVEAARCAVELQESSVSRNAAYPAARRMVIRIGMTVGDVVEQDGDLFGDGVNIAARLEGLAPLGGIYISNSFYEQVASKLALDFTDRGKKALKNIPQPVQVYELHPRLAVVPIQSPRSIAWGRARAMATVHVSPVVTTGFGIAVVVVAYLYMNHRSPSAVPGFSAPVSAPLPGLAPTGLPSIKANTSEPATLTRPAGLALPPAVSPEAATVAQPPTTAPQSARPLTVTAPPTTSLTVEPRRSTTTGTERKRNIAKCSEILVRAQLGDLSADDREMLQTQCR